jgi:hypothetical protein
MENRCSLTPNAAFLSETQHEMVRHLERYDMSFVFEKLLMDKKIRESSVPILEREFKRFIALTGLGVCPVAMIGPRVDDVWHQFILFTKRYKEFCQETVGMFIGHQPDTPSTPVPVVAGENFRSAYRRYFGDIPQIWFEGMSEETKRYYMQPTLVGKPPAAWSGWAGPE